MFPVVSYGRAELGLAITFRWSQASLIVKYSAEDTTLVVGNGAGETTILPVPAGTEIAIDVTALHYNRESHLIHQA